MIENRYISLQKISLWLPYLLSFFLVSSCMSSGSTPAKIDKATLREALTGLHTEINSETAPLASDAGTLQYLRFAVDHDAEIAALQQGVNAAKSNVHAAKSKLQPQVNATSSVGGYQSDAPDGLIQEAAAVGLTLSQLLYDGGLTKGKITTAELNLALAQAAKEEAVNRVSLEAANVGLAMTLASRQLEAVEKFRGEINPHLAQIKLMADSGLVDRSVLDELNGRLLELDLIAEEAQTAMRLAQIGYKKYFKNLPMPTTGFTLPKSFIDEFSKKEAAYDTPSSQRAALNVLIAEMNLKMAKSAFSPKISTQISATAPMDPDENTSAQAGIMLTYQFGDGGNRKANVANAEAKMKQAKQSAGAIIQNSQQSLAFLKEKKSNLENMIKLSDKKLNTFLTQLDVAQKQIQTGQADIRKVFEIKLKVNEINGELLRSRTELSRTQIEIAAALGAFSNQEIFK